ncbi:hypothetical protein [Halohasta litchfieldiae]|uniref:hypothetical protein n=1 Tax=Halohasta litchfieldiae TaxID=1073996 RepID=UPI0013A52C55|nr:hypothetical protein [Halohasta litchfieldiae]
MSPNIYRRRVLKNSCLAGSLGLLSGLSGCSQIRPKDDSELTEGDGVIIAERAESVPDSAVLIDYNDGRILDHEEIQEPIKEAVESGSARLPLKKPSVRSVQRILLELPKYSSEQSSEFDPGYYFKYEDEIVVVNLLMLREYDPSQ